ncbi:hypothetical protein NQ314_017154, partial [Rhamnusium bicolor]
RQLLAPAEIKLVNNDRIGASSRCDEPENNAPERQVTEKIPLEMDENVLFDPESEWITNRLSTKEPSKWIPGDIQPMPRQFPEPDYSRYKDMSPVELFELFFDENIYLYLAEQTQLYAHFKNKHDPEITSQEIRCFTAILILTGYNPLPSKRLYWDMKDDTHNQMVADSMRRDRFLKIQRFIHMADNTKMDRLWGKWHDSRKSNTKIMSDDQKIRISKKKRGYYEHIIERNDGGLLVRWMDNAVVTIASTSAGVHPEGVVKKILPKRKKNTS